MCGEECSVGGRRGTTSSCEAISSLLFWAGARSRSLVGRRRRTWKGYRSKIEYKDSNRERVTSEGVNERGYY